MIKRVLLWAGVAVLACVSVDASASDKGLVTVPSNNSVDVTIKRFEDAIVELGGDKGWMVFTRIDHAAAAEKNGLKLLPRTVIVFGNPKAGTAGMAKVATVAIDVPPKALVWQDDQGKVWLTYNSASYLFENIYPRHGLATPPTAAMEPFAKLLKDAAAKATQ